MVMVCTSLTPSFAAVSWVTFTEPLDWVGLVTVRPLILVFCRSAMNSIVKPSRRVPVTETFPVPIPVIASSAAVILSRRAASVSDRAMVAVPVADCHAKVNAPTVSLAIWS